MFKKLAFGALLLLICFIALNIQNTYGQENLVKVKSEAIELSVDNIYIPCEDPSNAICTPYPEKQTHPDPANPDHELGLTSSGLPPDTLIYIAGCINTTTGVRCTTGLSELDTLLNSMVGGDSMNPDPSHHFKVLNNPVKTDANGDLTVIVRSFTQQITTHFFNGYLIESQNLGPTTTANQPSVVPEEAIHLQNFTKSTPVPKPIRVRPKKPINKFTDQDPKGRLFDIKSLEPVSGVEASLLNSFKNLFSYKSIINPQIVQANGEFNFWVPNGIYYLSFGKIPPTHSWPIEMTNVHPNYSLAYYCDNEVKNDENGSVPLYYDQFSIIEYNKLVHCDVPLDPGTNAPIRSMVKTIDYGLSKSTSDNSLNYTGKVTHPFTKVQLVGETSSRVVAEIEADKLGYWKISLPQAIYPLTTDGLPDKVLLKYTKKDLTGKQIFKPVEGISFEPILSYIEGYSYDKNNQILSNAKVGVKQKNSDNVVFLSKSDKNGYFRIGSQYLPSFPYDLVFSGNSADNIVVSTSEFVNSNKDFLVTEKLNLVNTQNRDINLTTASTSSFRNLKTGQDQFPADEVVKNKPEDKQTKSSLSLFFGLILILIVGGLVVFKLVKAKNSSPPVSL